MPKFIHKSIKGTQHLAGSLVCGAMVLGFVGLSFFGFESFEKEKSSLNAIIHSKTILKINGQSLKIHSKLVQNPSKMCKRRSQIDENASLQRFRHQIAPRSAPGRST